MNLPADFSDRLSPMLVKELRQGMRTNQFTVSFILLQVFMVICLLLGTLAGGDGEEVSVFFWSFIGIAMVLVMPTRGFNALHKETQLNTMDLIQMTRLSAWRITFGKWLALVSQTLLLVTAILPYIVLRYYLGGVDLITEVLVLLSLCLASMVMTAVSVGFSAFASPVVRRVFSVLAILFVIQAGFGGLVGFMIPGGGFRVASFGVVSGSPASPWTTFAIVAIIVTIAAYVTYFFLDLGASRIAPEAANHATRKRLIGLGFVLICFTVPIFSADMIALTAVGTVALFVIWIDALTEKATNVPSILRPFVKRPGLRPTMYALTPGWHTALIFIILSAALVLSMLAINPDLDGKPGMELFADDDFTFAVICSLAGLVFPLLIIHLFFYPVTFSKFYFGLYLLIQICIAVITAMIGAASNIDSPWVDILYYCVPIPSVIAIGREEMNSISDEYFFTAAVVVLALSFLVPFLRGRLLFRKMRQNARDIDDEPSPPDADTDTIATSPAS